MAEVNTTDKFFVIAIGGTGMRCLESFVHLCAMGMFDNKEIDILTLDTDAKNGNKDRVEQLIATYNKVKGEESVTNSKTFFSAKLNLYKFYTDYTGAGRDRFKSLSASKENKEDNQDLADLFLDKDSVQEFNLAHGYRAQTHLGSMLMYHGIVESALNYAKDKENAKEQEKALGEYLTKLQQASEGSRVFIFGSIFGGTGASSIPVIPGAIKSAVEIVSGKSIDLGKVKFASTLLTQYFSFTSVDQNQKAKEKIIADSSNFSLNCQAAMQFYQNDNTVKACYKRFYHVGWPMEAVNVDNPGAATVITGGAEQKNGCHAVELVCACAAYDFFNLKDDDLIGQEAVYCYRSVDYTNEKFNFLGEDFVGATDGKSMLQHFGDFMVLKYAALGFYGQTGKSKSLRKHFQDHNIFEYDAIEDTTFAALDTYLQGFSEWVSQLHASTRGGKLMFLEEAYDEGKAAQDPCKVFQREASGFHFSDNRVKFEDVQKNFLPGAAPRIDGDDNQNAKTLNERFIAHVYNAIHEKMLDKYEY